MAYPQNMKVALINNLNLGVYFISQRAFKINITTFARLAENISRGTKFFSSNPRAILSLEDKSKKKPNEFMSP